MATEVIPLELVVFAYGIAAELTTLELVVPRYGMETEVTLPELVVFGYGMEAELTTLELVMFLLAETGGAIVITVIGAVDDDDEVWVAVGLIQHIEAVELSESDEHTAVLS